ncbi:hypothetical protein NUW58_g4485 [Xylaria curta]|uniref:Uncharacterized protein n=1 Tax=Xylaria curta TaxID=42375 RepID=A0ACC1P6A6_9PEZI|nr:hypothetical protein NUW58_g4485 [Xylaria curta]
MSPPLQAIIDAVAVLKVFLELPLPQGSLLGVGGVSYIYLLSHPNESVRIYTTRIPSLGYLAQALLMDPLSITASVIAIVGALGAIRKGYKSIVDLGKASQEFLDLVGEIEAVHAYLEMLHSVLDTGFNTQAFTTLDLTPLGTSLSRLECTIQKLQSALKQAETDSKTSEDGCRISKMKWQVYKSKVMQLRDEVRYRKQDLVDKIALLQLAVGLAWASMFGPGASLHFRVARVVKSNSTRAFLTVRYGTLPMLRYLMETGLALPNDTTPSGENLLFYAISYRQQSMVNYLLELGADAFQPDIHGMSPISLIRYQSSYSPKKTTGYLHLLAEDEDPKPTEYPLFEILKNGTDAELEHILNECPSLVNEPIHSFSTLLIESVLLSRYSAMELLLLRGANLGKRDALGNSALHYAITYDDYQATETLLRFPGSIFVETDGFNPLDLALEYSSSRVISLLISFGIGPSCISNHGSRNPFERLSLRSPRRCQDENDIEATVNQLLSIGMGFKDNGGKPCELAVYRDSYRLLRVLLKVGARFWKPMEGKHSVFHLAAEYATLNTIEVLRGAKIGGIDPDAEWGGRTATKIFKRRETCAEERLRPGQSRPTAEDSVSFRLLISEARERYKNERALLEAGDSVGDSSSGIGALSGEEQGKGAEEKPPLPGTWVE